MQIHELVEKQRRFYQTHRSKDVRFLKAALKKLRAIIQMREQEIKEALYLDLHKAPMESYMSEIGMVLSELTYQLRHVDTWSKPHKVLTPLSQQLAKSYKVAQPYGVVLIMSPWNYPFQLALEPAIGAIAAGNCVIIKPSNDAPHTSKVIAHIIKECFEDCFVSVVEGGRKENSALLEERFDYIFFTGGVNVGRIVMEKASRYLTPVTLELGGKSPCIIDESANIKLAAKRVAFGKFLNAGQTCVAPDYVLIHERVKHDFLVYLHFYLHKFYGDDPLTCENYGSIINEKHFLRLKNLMKCGNICIGGRSDETQHTIEPTVLENIKFEDAIMQEEIFGPILPVISYTNINDVIAYVNAQEHPLALYVFTTSKKIEQKVLHECSFGGGCINDTIIHLASSHMGFGGVGASGMGSYHGYDSFTTFSHMRSIVKKSNKMDVAIRYQPYHKYKEILIKLFMR